MNLDEKIEREENWIEGKCPNCNHEGFDFGWVSIQKGTRTGYGELGARICPKCGILFISPSDLKNEVRACGF